MSSEPSTQGRNATLDKKRDTGRRLTTLPAGVGLVQMHMADIGSWSGNGNASLEHPRFSDAVSAFRG